MRKCDRSVSIFVVAVVLFATSAAHAEWLKNGIPICTVYGQQSDVALVSGGSGGAFTVWTDMRLFDGYPHIYAQIFESDASYHWVTGGVPLCTLDVTQQQPRIVSDGGTGAIIAWADYRGDNWDIYAQRVSVSGELLWGADPKPVCTAAGDQMGLVIIAQNDGGALIAWTDNRGGDQDIYAQRIDANGDPLWATNGVAVCTWSGYQEDPRMVSDGASGAIIAFEDGSSGNYNIFAQRIDADGNVLWYDVTVIVAEVNTQADLEMVSDGTGGAYITWRDERNPSTDVYAQRIDGNGDCLWGTGGMALAYDYSLIETMPQIISDGAGGAIISWEVQHGPDLYNDIYVTRVDADGQHPWGYGGIPITHYRDDQYEHRTIEDGAGGAIIAWLDDRNGSDDIYAQRIDANGSCLWTENGVSVCSMDGCQEDIQLVSNGSGGAIIAWQDMRADAEAGIYLQNITGDGLWGNPAPQIFSCADIEEDEGGWVRLEVKASSHDRKLEKEYPIAGYNVWRKIDPIMVGSALPLAPAWTGTRSELLAQCKSSSAFRVSSAQARLLGLPPGDWESIGFHGATWDSVYYFAAPTRSDSTASGIPWEMYVVTAHTTTPGIVAASATETGYSVDNLAPETTPGLAGIQSLAPAGLRLSWAINPAGDIAHYAIHRGDAASFEPNESNLIGTTADTVLFDTGWAPFYDYFYKLLAVDRHGNASTAALLRPEDVKVGTLLASYAASYVSGVIEVTWQLSEASDEIAFFVMRSDGVGRGFVEIAEPALAREGSSFVFTDRATEPGMVYQYRIDLADGNGRRTLFETETISTPQMAFTLFQNFPNPFNPSTEIKYYLPEKCLTRLEVYDISGKRVASLLEGEQERGSHSVTWNGKDAQGKSVASGVYFYRLMAGKQTVSRRMVLLR